MSQLGRFISLAICAASIASLPVLGQGNCQNQFQYPGNAIIPDAGGAITSISTCSFESEYSQISGIQAGATYRFTLSTQGYITIREGAPGGPVVAQGYYIVDVLASSNADLYPHWNIDESCAQQSNCVITTVQYFGDCSPVLAFAQVVEDCDAQTFTIDVNVVSLGNGNSVDITADASGVVTVVEDAGLGITTIGPFFFGEQVSVVVDHELDVACSQDLGFYQESGECPLFIFCGQPAQTFTYCYSNNDAKVWNYVSQGGSGSLVISFLSGTVQSSFGDVLTIYDGTDNSGPVLFSNPDAGDFNLTGLVLASTTGALHIELVTDGFGSCDDATTLPWTWEVQCLNCQLPSASVSVVDDCPNNQFSIPVEVSSVGDGLTVSLVYTVNGGLPVLLTGIGLGETVLGPFTVNDVVSIFVQHDSDPACTVSLGTFTDNGNCPTLIVCGDPAFEETYCYVANDIRSWGYQSVGSGTLRMTFIRGTIESSTWDHLRIYDGADASGTLVFDHTSFATYNLGPVGSAVNNALTDYYGIQVYSTTGSIYMEMTSDGSVQCGEPFPNTTYDSWEWEVVCLDCEVPQGTVAVVDDCANDQFSLDIEVTSTGDAGTASVTYSIDGGAPTTQTGLPLGITTIGPFNFGEVVNVTLAHESNSLCDIPKGNFTETGTCPELITCGTPYDVSYCYANNNDVRWYFQGTGTFPLGVLFTQGSVYAGDLIEVYDGGDINAPLIYSGNGTAENVAGLFFYTTNPDHRMTVRLLANGFTDCATNGNQVPVEFTVDCLDCVPPTATFGIVQDCANFQYSVAVNITSLGSASSMQITNTGGANAVTANGPGTYTVGPFTSGTSVSVTIVNADNSLCNISSGTLVNPLCPTILCGGTPLVETYCYTNSENRAWAWQAPSAGATLQLQFIRGTIESNTWDRLTIYDGPDANSPQLFNHGTGTTNLGPVGSAINGLGWLYETVNVTSTSGNLYMTLTTDLSVACNTAGVPNTSYDPWEWQVSCIGCSAPGVAYNLVSDCLHRVYKTEVIITQPPSAQGMTIENMITGQTQSVTTTGVYEFGPYANDALSIFGVTDLSEPGCTWLSDSLTFPSDSCIIVSCGFDNYEYCYENNEDRWYTYRSAQPVPTTIAFLQGQMLTGDRIVVYNGVDETATVIYQGNNGGNLTGFAVNSQNPGNAITLRIQSNATGSCDDGQVLVPLRWTVGCGAVGVEELAQGGFAVYPNPTDGLLHLSLGDAAPGLVRVRVMDVSGRTVIEQSMNYSSGAANSIDMQALQSGQYMVQVATTEWTKVQRVQVTR